MVCLHTDTMGVHPACILFDGQGYSPPRPGIPPETTPPILHILPLIAHQLASARKKRGSLAFQGSVARVGHIARGVSDRRAKQHWRRRCSGYFSDDGPFELAAETCPGQPQMRVRKERANAAMTVRIEPVQNLVGRDALPMGLWRRPHGSNS